MSENKDFFSRKMFTRLLVPSMVSYAGLAFGDVADAVVVGNKLGVTGLAAISFALPVFMIINVIMHGFGAGGSIVYSRLLGEGRQEEAQKNFNGVFAVAMMISVILAIIGNVFFVPFLRVLGVNQDNVELFNTASEYIRIIVSGFPLFTAAYVMNYYLRNDENERIASIGFTVANIIDVVLNIVFVLMLDMGAKGAAYSTLIGQGVAILFYLPCIVSGKNNLRFSFVRLAIIDAFKCFKTGFSTSVQYIFSFVFIWSANNILMKTGSDTGVAVFEIIQNASLFLLYIYEGITKAAQPLISTFCGERNKMGMHKILKYSIVSGCLLGGVGIAFVMLFPGLVCRLFGVNEPEVTMLAIRAIRIYCIAAFFAGLNILIENYQQSCEKDKNAYVIALLRGAVVLIPVTYLFSMVGVNDFWWLYPVTEIVSFITSLLWIRFYKKEKKIDFDKVYTCTISSIQEISEAMNGVENFCEENEASPEQVYYVTMVFEEICVAIMKQFNDDKDGRIQVTMIACENEFELHIRDNAVLYNPFEEKCDTVCLSDDFDDESIGILLIKNTAKDFFYRRYQGFNSLVVRI